MNDNVHPIFKPILEAITSLPDRNVKTQMFPTPQENANRAWQKLGKEMGFVWDSCEPFGDDPRNFRRKGVQSETYEHQKLT